MPGQLDPGGFLANLSGGYNFTAEELAEIFSQEAETRNFAWYQEIALIAAYSVLIIFGAMGNGLVCFIVAKNPHMRTPRNIFIINLAISDLTLCLFTTPFTLLKIIHKDWNLGEFMCKFVSMFQGTNVFVSTISITAIALDRFQVIVYPTKDNMKKFGAAASLICIWIISFLMASPLLIFSVLKTFPLDEDIVLYQTCIEDINLGYARGSYSIASMLVQYIVPIIIVSIAHLKICNKLKYRMVNQQSPGYVTSPHNQRKKEREARRKRRTNLLLLMIGVVFVLCWLPLNVTNILLEYVRLYDINISLMFAICQLLVLSSACANPVLYGWLNENFRREFINVLYCACCQRLRSKMRREANSNTDPQEGQSTTQIKYTKANGANGAAAASCVTINEISKCDPSTHNEQR